MTRPTRPRVVVLGGGFAGLSAARELRSDRYDVTLVDRRRFFEFLPNIHELLSGVKSPDLLRIPLERSARRLGHRFLRETLTAIDLEERRLEMRRGRSLPYDAMVFALGGVNATHGIPGAEQHALPFKSVDECARIGRELARLARRRKGGEVVIVGGGLEGVEALGEILRLHRRSGRLRVTVVEAQERLLSEAPAQLHDHVVALCEGHQVLLEMGVSVSEVEEKAVALADGRRLVSDLTIWTGGPAPSPLLAASGLAPPEQWAPVHETLQSRKQADVMIAGDACAPAEPLPKQGYHAIDMGVRAADNAGRLLAGRPLRPFKPSSKPTLISFGDLSCFLVLGRRVLAGAALAAGKEAVFEWVMDQLDAAPWWRRAPRAADRAQRAARRLLWPAVSSPRALLRQAHVSLLSDR